MGAQAQHLDAVTARIGVAILTFCWPRIGQTFRADELRRHVVNATGTCAPASADRVLRELRRRGAVDYQVVSRRDSLYLVLSVSPEVILL